MQVEVPADDLALQPHAGKKDTAVAITQKGLKKRLRDRVDAPVNRGPVIDPVVFAEQRRVIGNKHFRPAFQSPVAFIALVHDQFVFFHLVDAAAQGNHCGLGILMSPGREASHQTAEPLLGNRAQDHGAGTQDLGTLGSQSPDQPGEDLVLFGRVEIRRDNRPAGSSFETAVHPPKAQGQSHHLPGRSAAYSGQASDQTA